MDKQKKYRLHLGNDHQGLNYDCCMAAGNTLQEVKVVKQSWEPVYVDIVE